MGKPRLIILVRHGQSEGNKNRDIHQYIPDHRVKLTPEGWGQAEDAGRRLKAMLRQDDTIRIFTSPYRRTRETTEGILRTLTADDEETGPTPFKREQIKVYEEPRLREQDFGNFQPCSIEMERMWQERADYGHFFYRIPDGESAADAYDRISGFNESMWRQFGDEDFPSVCILVTHGLMTRVFLMKWYHWSVEYFEDLRNIHHCEFIVMEKDDTENPGPGKYSLLTTLRTWSELHKEKTGVSAPPSPKLPARRWGGCAMGCNHHNMSFPKHTSRTSTLDFVQAAVATSEHEDHANSAPEEVVKLKSPLRTRSVMRFNSSTILHDYEKSGIAGSKKSEGAGADHEPTSESDEGDDEAVTMPINRRRLIVGRDGGGSQSGIGTPAETDDSDDSEDQRSGKPKPRITHSKSSLAVVKEEGQVKSDGALRKNSATSVKTIREWEQDSGMAAHKKADLLGDAQEEEEGVNQCDIQNAIDSGELKADEGTAKGDVY
jgi:broad specificity phosphatase PhoE